MDFVWTAAGALLVAVALRDVFDTLLHPHGRGTVSQALIRLVWRAFRAIARGNHGLLSLAGPIAFILVIAVWGALVVVGFALLFYPHFPGGFHADPSAGLGDGSFVDALYLSLVNLTSLGYGDIVPTLELLRLLGPLETLIGLGLLTAGISWILFLYRVLSDYRSLSHEIQLLSEAEDEAGVALSGVDPAVAAAVLADLTSRVVAMRDDLVHSPIAYYFHPHDDRHALGLLLPTLLREAERCGAEDNPTGLRFHAALLQQAVADLLETISRDFAGVQTGDPERALDAYCRDHMWSRD